MAEVESEEITTDSDIQLAEDNSKVVTSYDEACNDYHNTEVERTNNLNNMQKIITRLLKKGNVTVGTQTSEESFHHLHPMLSHHHSAADGGLLGGPVDTSDLKHMAMAHGTTASNGDHHGLSPHTLSGTGADAENHNLLSVTGKS